MNSIMKLRELQEGQWFGFKLDGPTWKVESVIPSVTFIRQRDKLKAVKASNRQLNSDVYI